MTTRTTGAPLDPDGYTVTFPFPALPAFPIGINDTVILDSLEPRDLRVQLDSVAPSCSVVSASYPLLGIGQTSAHVFAGLNTDVDFTVECGVLPPGRIAFVAASGDTTDVYLMNTDGTDLTRVTFHGGGTPAWSPDGRQLAFFCADGGAGLCLADSNGAGLHRLTSDGGYLPVWSPDGTRIGYVCGDSASGSGDLCVVGSEGSGRVNLTGGIGFNTSLSWSPDGSHLVFARSVIDTAAGGLISDRRTIQIVHPDGSGLQQLTADSLASAPAWSPTSDFIVFLAPGGIVRVRSDGIERTELFQLLHPAGSPVWSPDGTRIAFSLLLRKNSNLDDIWVMNADGGNLYQVTQFGGRMPVWSPDGMHLAFTRYGDGNLYSIGIDGSHITTLRSFPGFAGGAAWQPHASSPLQVGGPSIPPGQRVASLSQ